MPTRVRPRRAPALRPLMPCPPGSDPFALIPARSPPAQGSLRAPQRGGKSRETSARSPAPGQRSAPPLLPARAAGPRPRLRQRPRTPGSESSRSAASHCASLSHHGISLSLTPSISFRGEGKPLRGHTLLAFPQPPVRALKEVAGAHQGSRLLCFPGFRPAPVSPLPVVAVRLVEPDIARGLREPCPVFNDHARLPIYRYREVALFHCLPPMVRPAAAFPLLFARRPPTSMLTQYTHTPSRPGRSLQQNSRPPRYRCPSRPSRPAPARTPPRASRPPRPHL